MRFDGDTGEHAHIRCSSCGRVDDVGAGALAGLDRRSLQRALHAGTGYHVSGCTPLFQWLCPTCARRAGRERNGQQNTGG